MDSTDINLIKVETASPKNRRAAKLRMVALIILFFVGGVAIIFFILDFSSPLNSIKSEQDAVLSSITAENQKAVKLAIVNERATAINRLKIERPDYLGVLNTAMSTLPSGVSASGLDIDESSVSITVASPSLLSLNNFLNGVLDEARKNSNIESASMESLTANDTSSAYQMSVKFNLK